MNYLPTDKQFLLCWFKNFLEIERSHLEDDNSKEETSIMTDTRPEQRESIPVPLLENNLNNAIVEDPRFEGTT